MKRTLLIARREFFAYARTVGFWLSILSLPFFMSLGAIVPILTQRVQPVKEVTILDLTGADRGAALERALEARWVRSQISAMETAARTDAGPQAAEAVRAAAEAGGVEAGRAEMAKVAPRAAKGWTPPRRDLRVTAPPPELAAVADLEAAEAVLKPMLAQERARGEAGLDAAALIVERDGDLSARVWSRTATDRDVEFAVRDALREVAREERLAAAGLGAGTLAELERLRPRVEVYSPRSAEAGGPVGLRDRAPMLVGLIAGLALWAAVIGGASILLNSVMEEKANRVLEVLLSSASTAEILTGKVLGVAFITLTTVAVWALLAGGFLATAAPAGLADAVAPILTDGRLLLYLGLYLVGGYLMYAVVFAAIGAFCDTPRDAQTLLGPVMLTLMVPLFAMLVGIRTPDAPWLEVMSWIPFFTPFLMSARAPTGLSEIEVAGSLALMSVTALVMIWLSARAFRAGAISGIKLEWRNIGALLGGGR